MRDPVIVVLAGGQARRMGGGDKALRLLAGRALVAHVLERVGNQGRRIVINANGPPERFAAFGCPVVADSVPNWPGPLAGVLAGMEWAVKHVPDATDILTVPCDAPFLPRDLSARLGAARGADIACAESGGRVHPVVALWPIRLAAALRAAVTSEGIRRVEAFMARYDVAPVAWPILPVDPFLNLNRPEELAAAEAILYRSRAAEGDR